METVGVWLPRGFTYTVGSSNLEANPGQPYYSVPAVQSHQGNQALLWTFSSVPFGQFPGADQLQFPVVAQITFQFTSGQSGASPTSLLDDNHRGCRYSFSWDADNSVYQIVSTAGNTTVEAYTLKQEIRHMRSAVPGDYIAAGNSLMIDTNHDWHGIRDVLLGSSDATVSAIPEDATVGAAYLYWSAWLDDPHMTSVFSDVCSDFGDWISGSTWNISSGHFRSHYSSGTDDTRYNT